MPLRHDPFPGALPVLPSGLEAVLGRLGVPCCDPRVGGRLGRALAQEPVAGGGSARLVDAGGISSAGHGPRVARWRDS